MTTCDPAPSPGVSHMKGAAEDEAPLGHKQQHKQDRRLVGKVQWLAYTRPDISYGATELAISLQAPTQFDNKKLKHMIRYLKGTRYLRHNLQPKGQANPTRHRHIHRCQLGIMRENKKEHNRISVTLLRSSDTRMEAEHKQQWHFHQKSQNWYSSTGEPLHQKLHQGSNWSTHQHQDIHRQQRS